MYPVFLRLFPKDTQRRCKTISEDTQKMLQSQSTAFPRHQRGEIRKKTMTKQVPHTKPTTHKERRTATEGPPWKVSIEKLLGVYSYKTSPLILIITKTYLCNFDPLKPHFYIVKLGFTGVYIIFFLFLLKNIECVYSLGGNISAYLNRHVFVMVARNYQIYVWSA